MGASGSRDADDSSPVSSGSARAMSPREVSVSASGTQPITYASPSNSSPSQRSNHGRGRARTRGQRDEDGGEAAAHTPGSTSLPASLTARVRNIISPEEEDEFEEKDLFESQRIVTTLFSWNNGGNDVFLSGSFNGWTPVPMVFSEASNTFSLAVNLIPGKYLYHFVVDKRIMHDPELPVASDSAGNVTNVLDLKLPSNISPPTTARFAEEEALSDEEHFADSDDEFGGDGHIPYGQELPEFESGVAPHRVPPHFGEILLNSRIRTSTPVALPVPLHVVLNHTYLRAAKASSSILVLGITQRYRGKYVTTVYYKNSG